MGLKKLEIIYYVVEYATQPGEGYFDELTGYKDITCYTIHDNVPKVLCELHLANTVTTEYLIEDWLLDNIGKKNYELKQL